MNLRPMILVLLSLLATSLAPRCDAAPSYAHLAAQMKQSPGIEFSDLDMKSLEAEDALTDKVIALPKRFAVGRDVQLTPLNAGEWSQASNGDAVWRLAVHAAGAVHLNFGFRRFDLPPGAELIVVSATDKSTLGPFTERDELPHGQLWTPVLIGERAILQLTVPASKRTEIDLELTRIGQGYRGFGFHSATCKSGSCNTDVACLAATDPWNEPRRAVGAFTAGGVDTCTGSLLNNTSNNRRMLFATAGHCHISTDAQAASVVVYWNYESPTCRTPGSTASGSPIGKPTSTTPGLRFLAATDAVDGSGSFGTRSDWTLLELATPPANNNFNLFWAGWDRSPPPMSCSAPSNPASTTGLCASIHHPGVDEKRITFVETTLTLGDYVGAAQGLHWDARWDPTPPLLPNIQPPPSSLPPSVTERGSSGSPLYNAQRRMIGVLSGGPSACGSTGADLRDYYGGLFHAWEGLGTPSTRMRDWLDPAGSGVSSLDGINTGATLSVQLNSAAFTTPPVAGAMIDLSAVASGGNGNYTYEWDTDNDGIFERSSSSSALRLSYPAAVTTQVQVRVRDSAGATGTSSRPLTVIGATLTATAGTPAQVCGDNDGAIEPGERWRVPVTLRNNGAASLPASARALFAPGAASTGALPIGPNSFGYRATTSAAGGCSYNFVDIGAGANSVPALATIATNNNFGPLDDARTTDTLVLGGGGFRLYGQNYTQAVMSTNGYISFSSAETGGDFSNDCAGAYTNGAVGPQLRVHHDDLVVSTQAGAGLRYRYFSTCPRGAESDRTQAQGCHVFQWSRMQLFTDGGASVGDFDFEAVAYDRTGQVSYQYRSAAPDAGANSTIGISNPAGTDPLNVTCNSANAAPALSAVCVFEPSALPSTSSPLRLETPTVAVTALAPGQQAVVDAPIALPANASCGAPLALDYIGTAAPGSFSLDTKAVLNATVGAGGACQIINNCPAQVPTIATRPGFYFNTQRPGNGLASFVYGSIYGSVWYTALPDRSPTWYIVNGTYADHLGQAPLTRFRNTAAPTGFAPDDEVVGKAWIAQIDNDSLLYAWTLTGGLSGAELMDATPLPFTTPNHSQTWYSTSESGWGLSIESLLTSPGSFLEFIVGYIYDSSGSARWVLGTSDSITGGSVSLSTYRVHCPACPWFSDYESTAQPAGSLSRTYTGPTSATFSSAITLPAPLSGTWNRTNLPITTIGPPASGAGESD